MDNIDDVLRQAYQDLLLYGQARIYISEQAVKVMDKEIKKIFYSNVPLDESSKSTR